MSKYIMFFCHRIRCISHSCNYLRFTIKQLFYNNFHSRINRFFITGNINSFVRR
eukprot:UN07286